ncbi:uncharacterized protein LOC111831443 [Capsella rubella]|uniref:uncharacterized protein LOC111831443 n=1 Tax=Capsella rubella TaxID=81985 RepID=UPI000CD558F8|nr:uncharacterized protein LOC111831443 [Capsella rubella]
MDQLLLLQAMANNKKSIDDFLDELDTIESLAQKLAKIDEHLKKLYEENKENDDMEKNIQVWTRRSTNEAIAQILAIRQNLLSPPPSTSLQPPASSSREFNFFPTTSDSYPLRPPHSSDGPRPSNFSSSPSSAFKPFQSYNNPPRSSPALSSSSSSPSQPYKRLRLSNINSAPLSSSPLPLFNPFLLPHPQDSRLPQILQDPLAPPLPNLNPLIFQDPLALPLPNPIPIPIPIPIQPRPRVVWTERLQQVFDSAVARLGGLRNATGNRVYNLMHTEGLTREQVTSHLRVMRNRRRELADDLNS